MPRLVHSLSASGRELAMLEINDMRNRRWSGQNKGKSVLETHILWASVLVRVCSTIEADKVAFQPRERSPAAST